MIKNPFSSVLLLLVAINFGFKTGYGQTSNSITKHPLEAKLDFLLDSLTQSGVDTIITFRFSEHTNGFNGEGLVIWKKNSKWHEATLTISRNGSVSITNSNLSSNQTKTFKLFHFFVDNRLDTTTNELKNPPLNVSHDSRYTASIKVNTFYYQYSLNGLVINYNKSNLKSIWLLNLKEHINAVDYQFLNYFKFKSYPITYQGNWATTSWYYTFLNDSVFRFISSGHFGNTKTFGTYFIQNDTLVLNSPKVYTDSTLVFDNFQLKIDGDSCIYELDTKPHYDYCIQPVISELTNEKDTLFHLRESRKR